MLELAPEAKKRGGRKAKNLQLPELVCTSQFILPCWSWLQQVLGHEQLFESSLKWQVLGLTSTQDSGFQFFTYSPSTNLHSSHSLSIACLVIFHQPKIPPLLHCVLKALSLIRFFTCLVLKSFHKKIKPIWYPC